jgi:hypothetical protein
MLNNPEMRSHLQDLIETCNWWQLSPHLSRLVVVSLNLTLLDVGLALTADDSAQVKQWIADGGIYHPSAEQIAYWQANPQISFTSLIIYPFILFQELKSV